MPIQPQTKQPDIYWKLLSDTPYASTSPMKPYFYSGRDTKVEHAQMQWLFQGVMIHMTLQAQVSVNKDHNFDFQCEVPGTGGRLYSPIGYYMHEDQFDAYTARKLLLQPLTYNRADLTMINPNSKRGRAMLLAAQTQERPAAPPKTPRDNVMYKETPRHITAITIALYDNDGHGI